MNAKIPISFHVKIKIKETASSRFWALIEEKRTLEIALRKLTNYELWIDFE